MNRMRILYQLAIADLKERTRRYSFLLTLGLTILAGYLLVPPPDASYTSGMHIYVPDSVSGHFRGLYNSAWVGGMIALMTSLFLSLFGFYLVKNTLERDRQTGVGEILATTPLSKWTYMVGKWFSNLAVLMLMVGILVLAALAMQLVRGEEPHVDLWPLLSPFLLIALPVLALVAAVALLFETLPGLRGGLGNVGYFFLWIGTLAAGLYDRLFGTGLIESSVMEAAARTFPQYELASAIGINPEGGGIVLGNLQTFRWEGIAWRSEQVLQRLMLVVLALLVTLLATVLFNRFDPARGPLRQVRPTIKQDLPPAAPVAGPQVGLSRILLPASLTRVPMRFDIWSLLLAELRLMLKGNRWWWYLGAAGLILACLAGPADQTSRLWLPLAWLWPLLIWSAMGVRETRHRTGQLIFSTAHPLRRQLAAVWLAGLAITMLAGSGAAIRLLLANDWHGLLTWASGAVFIPSLALTLGTWSGHSKLFEVSYTLWWYAALNRIAALDFMGVMGSGWDPTCLTDGKGTPARWLYPVLTLLLIGLAVLGRKRQSVHS